VTVTAHPPPPKPFPSERSILPESRILHASDASNYQVTGAVVDSAQLLPDRNGVSNVVVLAISGISSSGFQVGIAPGRGIADLFGDIQTGNPLASGNVFAFGSGLTDDAIIGTLLDPVEAGSISVDVSQRLQVVASGSDIGGVADAFNFVYGLRADDFDLKVRVSGLDPRDSLSKAGFVVRESLSPGSPAVSAVITPQGVALDGSGPGPTITNRAFGPILDGDTTEWDRNSARPTRPLHKCLDSVATRWHDVHHLLGNQRNGLDGMGQTESSLPESCSSVSHKLAQTTTSVRLRLRYSRILALFYLPRSRRRRRIKP